MCLCKNLHQIKITGTWTEFYSTKTFVELLIFTQNFEWKLANLMYKLHNNCITKKNIALCIRKGVNILLFMTSFMTPAIDLISWLIHKQRPDPTHNNINTVITVKLHKWLVCVKNKFINHQLFMTTTLY